MDLNAEQKKIAFQKPKGHFLIKGVAGSGKTTVGIYRIPFLLGNYCFAPDDAILLVTYNRTLIKYAEYLYSKVRQKALPDFQTLFVTPRRNVDIRTIDSIMFEYYREYAREHDIDYKVGVDNALGYEIIRSGIALLKKEYPDVNVLDQSNTLFLHDEIHWIKDCNYIREEKYQKADRVGLMTGRIDNGPRKLLKNSSTRKAVFELMRYFDQAIRKAGLISFSDMRIMALEQMKTDPRQRYSHIIVDESQDLTRIQLCFLKELYLSGEHSSIGFIVDTAQSIYPQSWIGNGRSFASIGFNMVGKSNNLSKNFRTTTQISLSAYSLIALCREIVEDENFVKPQLIDKQGEFPVCRIFRTEKDQADYIQEQITTILASHRRNEIAIVARNRAQLESLKVMMERRRIPCAYINNQKADFQSDSVKLLTIHAIKGLEFSVVFMAGLNFGIIPHHTSDDPFTRAEEEIKERRLFYVGMTRATRRLYILSSSRPSPFIGDIDPRYLRLDPQIRMRKFYGIPLEDFRFKERVRDLYSSEESVRQWVISELIRTYQYPLDTIVPEFPVYSFSKKGYVDIAVVPCREGGRKPLILVETKKPGLGIAEGTAQMKSYLNCCDGEVYGLITDGNEISVIDRQHAPVADIPIFNPAWVPDGLHRYAFTRLKTNRTFQLSMDADDPSILEVSDGRSSEMYPQEDLAAVSVYGKIAAGIPLEMNPELEESFYLPRSWQKGGAFFILKIQGDSMVNADIQDGDYVLVRKQATADNLDIVVAAAGEEATLKKFSRMGNTILLLSENPAYDPIMLDEDQVTILGIASGIIRWIGGR